MRNTQIGSIFVFTVLLFLVGCKSNPTLTPTPPMIETEIVEVQPVPPWYQVYWEGKENAGSNVLILSDGGFLVVGSMEAVEKHKIVGGIMLFETDKFGNPLWLETYGGEEFDYGWDIAEATDGGFVIVGVTTSFDAIGRDGYVLKVDQNGQLVWSKNYGGELNDVFNSIHPTPDGEYFILGNVEDPNDFITDPGAAGYGGFAGRSNLYLVKLDNNGNLIWSKVVDSEQNVLSLDGLVSEEGDLYAIATLSKYPDPGDDLLLYKFDPNGEQIWVRIWEEGDLGGYAMAKDKDGNIIITGVSYKEDSYGSKSFLLKVDEQGNEIFFKEFGEPNMFEIGQDVISLEENRYAVLTFKTPSLFVSMSNISILVVDSTGEVLWESTLELDLKFKNIKGARLHQYPDGGFVIVGNIITYKDEFHTLLIKTDPDGKVE